MCFIDALIVLLRGLTHWKAEGENCINYDFFSHVQIKWKE